VLVIVRAVGICSYQLGYKDLTSRDGEKWKFQTHNQKYMYRIESGVCE
jgi:hypothetical protein